MVFKVGGQRNSQVAVDRCGYSVPPGSKRGRTRGDGERGIACGSGIELDNKSAQVEATRGGLAATNRNCSMDNG